MTRLTEANTLNRVSSNLPIARRPALVIWLVFCTFCSCAGWILSAFHALNRLGYSIAFLLAIAATLVWFKGSALPHLSLASVTKLRNRFRRIWPSSFLVLATLAFLGGVLHAPSNYDALAYRVPRVLHWLAEGRWHWIHTGFQRINTRGCGFEWLAAPLIALTQTDRLLFLFNVVSFCLLPGLVFACLRRLGISFRVAYCWMWLMPLGYCFLLQAGSLGNDLYTATLILASVEFGLRARDTGRVSNLWLSTIAFALATGAKANTLPLALVWAVLITPCLPLLKNSAASTLAVAVISLVVSFVPTAVLNWKHGGDWTGGRAENVVFQSTNPLARLVGNTGIVLINNLSPPIAPFAKAWNERIAEHLMPESLKEDMSRSFMTSPPLLSLEEMQTEEAAGFGWGGAVLLGVSFLAALTSKHQDANHAAKGFNKTPILIFLAAAVGLVACLEASSVKSTARLLCPYYALLVFPLLLPQGQKAVVRTAWWRWLTVAIALVAGFLLVINPARPLFPARQMVNMLRQAGFPSGQLARANRVYSVYRARSSAFAPALRALPVDAATLGFVTYDDPETSLWKPFGRRRIVHVCEGDTAEKLKAAGIRYILVGTEKFPLVFRISFDNWLAKLNARVIQSIPLDLRAGTEGAPWKLVELQ